jgi:hypothetical protein
MTVAFKVITVEIGGDQKYSLLGDRNVHGNILDE